MKTSFLYPWICIAEKEKNPHSIYRPVTDDHFCCFKMWSVDKQHSQEIDAISLRRQTRWLELFKAQIQWKRQHLGLTCLHLNGLKAIADKLVLEIIVAK